MCLEKGNKAVKDLERECYEEQQRALILFSLKQRRLKGRPHRSLHCPEGGCGELGVSLCSQVTVIGQEVMASNCTRGGSGWILGNVSSPKEW